MTERVSSAEAVRLLTNAAKSHGRHQPGVMNNLEAEYATMLEVQKRQGLIFWYGFEAITLKIGERCKYTPDFALVTHDGDLRFIEIKGTKAKRSGNGKTYYAKDDSIVKIKTAAAQFPCFHFELKWKDGSWQTRIIS